MNIEFYVKSPEEMEHLGADLIKRFLVGNLITLSGPLGAGKTTLVRGMLSELGWKEPVRSPTYNLFIPYSTTPPVLHADLYRVASIDGTGLEDYLDSHLCLVEWSGALGEMKPDFGIEIAVHGTVRTVTLSSDF